MRRYMLGILNQEPDQILFEYGPGVFGKATTVLDFVLSITYTNFSPLSLFISTCTYESSLKWAELCKSIDCVGDVTICTQIDSESSGVVTLPLILPTGSQSPKNTNFEKSTLPLSHVLLRLSNQSRILK